MQYHGLHIVGMTLIAACSASPASSGTNTSPRAEPAETGGSGASFDPNAFYTISTTVNGQEYLLTFVLPTDSKVYSNSPRSSKVELRARTGENTQRWRMTVDGSVAEKDLYLIYTRVKDDETSNEPLAGIMKVVNPDGPSLESEGDSSSNRLTIGWHQNQMGEYWKLARNDDGTYRMTNDLGQREHLAPPGDGDPEKWTFEAALEAVLVNGKPVLRHRKPSRTPGQAWKIERTGS